MIGLRQGDASISLEPAGQLELSGAPLATLHETKAELEAHFAQLRCPARDLRIGFAPLGFHPLASRADDAVDAEGPLRDHAPLHADGRHARPRHDDAHLHGAGQSGLRLRSGHACASCASALLLQPLATALFANSPFTEGRPNGFLSYRAHVWTDTDNQRSGIPAVFFEDGFGFERYAEWLIDEVPMYFVYRDGDYIDVAGAIVPRVHGRAAAQPGRHRADGRRFRRSRDHRLHRCPAEAVPGNARRRRRIGRR